MCCNRNRKSYLKQFFGASSSAGSIIMQALNLFKTFQRLSAPKSFALHFSHDCFKFFSWAIDFVKIIFGSELLGSPVSDFELFQIFTFVFPLTILTFICAMILKKKIYVYFLIVAVFAIFGLGIKLLQVYFIAGIPITIVSLIIIVLIILKIIKLDILQFLASIESNDFIITMSFLNTGFIMFVMMIPIFAERWPICVMFSMLFMVTFFLMAFIEACCHCSCCPHEEEISSKTLMFVINLLSLLIIPSTEYFVKMVQSIRIWNMIVGYIIISIIFPFFFNLMMIIVNHSKFSSKYKQTNTVWNKYYFFEIGDIFKQIVYSFFAIYDIIWGCIFIEIIWIVLLIVFRPYADKSEYVISVGNTLIVTISNSVILYYNYHKSTKFSFTSALIIVVFACAPAIVSIYVFFICDFTFDECEIDEECFTTPLSIIILYIAPIIWAIYGLNIWTTYI